jgi:hypothetical protein
LFFFELCGFFGGDTMTSFQSKRKMTRNKLMDSVDLQIEEMALQSDARMDVEQEGDILFTREQLREFVEYIVQECSAVCDRIYFDRYPDAEDYERSEEGQAILERFGIDS